MTHPLPHVVLLCRHMLCLLLLTSSDQHSVDDIWQELVNTWMSSPQTEQRRESSASLQWRRLQTMNCRQISCEDSVCRQSEVKWRKRWKSSKGSKRWSCPDVAPNSSSTYTPAEESQVPNGPSPRDSSRLSRFSFFRKSFARSRKENRTLMKHSSCDDLLEVSSREEVHPAVLHSVGANGVQGSACSFQWVESSDKTQEQDDRRAESHDDLLHRVALECGPSTCSMEMNSGDSRVQSQPKAEGEGTVVPWRRRLKRIWDSLKTN